MSLITAGIALVVVGGAAKLAIKSYRKIRAGQFFDNTQQAQKAHYKGTFSTVLTRREAQLILGVREGTTAEQLKVRHRTLLLLNHPDHGILIYE